MTGQETFDGNTCDRRFGTGMMSVGPCKRVSVEMPACDMVTIEVQLPAGMYARLSQRAKELGRSEQDLASLWLGEAIINRTVLYDGD